MIFHFFFGHYRSCFLKAAMAYDRAAVRQGRPKEDLNFPDGVDHLPPESSDDEDDEDKKFRYINVTGFKGVSKYDDARFLSSIVVGEERYYLGLFGDKKTAAVAFDEAVLQYEQHLDLLNYPAK
jgi:hypothetical protein